MCGKKKNIAQFPHVKRAFVEMSSPGLPFRTWDMAGFWDAPDFRIWFGTCLDMVGFCNVTNLRTWFGDLDIETKRVVEPCGVCFLSLFCSFLLPWLLQGCSCCNATLWTTRMRRTSASAPLWSIWRSRLLPWMSSFGNNRRSASVKKPPPKRIWRIWNSRCLRPRNSYLGPWCLQKSRRVLQKILSFSISVCFLVCRFFFVFFHFHTCRFFLSIL